MKIQSASIVLLALAMHDASAFTIPSPSTVSPYKTPTQYRPFPTTTQIFSHSREEQKVADEEIERLKTMAQKLRAEAALLEAERAEELAEAAQHAFEKFDLNKDGEITFEELKLGLEKVLKTELPDERVQKLMEDFDVSGDGKLQLDEFVGVEKFRNRLESLAREEKQQARDAAKEAEKEKEMAKLLEARMNMLNDGAPTTKDRIISVIPYLFPLLDSLQFGRFIVMDNPENPFVIALALLYTAYRAIPFSGFVAFLALNFLSGNLGLNRLIRFNMQQAIFLDIALFFPGLFGAVLGLIAGGAGNPIPPSIAALGSDAVFGALVLTVAYASISSLLGITPDKIPVISKTVDDRIPTIDMFDEKTGRFMTREEQKQDGESDKKD